MIVSNSNMETYDKCPRMFYYSVIRNLTPKKMIVPIKRGSFGHKCVEKGMEAIIHGASLEEAISAAYEPVPELMDTDSDAGEMIGVARHAAAFISYYKTNPKVEWEPVALEAVEFWDLTADAPVARDNIPPGHIVFAYTPDIIIKWTGGLFKGQTGVLDYKFLGQYMVQSVIDMAVQIPKYIIYRGKNNPDEKVRRGAFVQFNTRAAVNDTGHKLFLLKWIEPTKSELATIERENFAAALDVVRLKEQSDALDSSSLLYRRTQVKETCGRCWFQELCRTERQGKDGSKIIERDFKDNDYGY